MTAAVQTRWCYAWAVDERSGRIDLWTRDLAALNTLADGTMGGDLPQSIREVLPAVAARANERDRELAASGRFERYRGVPHLVILRGEHVEHFEASSDWDALLARLA